MYIKGVSDINTTKSKRSKSIASQAVEKSTQKGVFASYLKKELINSRILLNFVCNENNNQTDGGYHEKAS